MAAELRWILLALSVPVLAGIWWWTARRSRQAHGNAELRETAPAAAQMHTPFPAEHSFHSPALDGSASYESALELRTDAGSRDFGVPPFEPLSVRTADFDEVQIADMRMTAGGEPVDAAENLDFGDHHGAHRVDHHADHDVDLRSGEASDYPGVEAAEHPAAAFDPDPSIDDDAVRAEYAARHTEHRAAPSSAPVSQPSPAPTAGETQRIVTLRVCADEESRWNGSDLMAALENHGLAYGRYKVFHRMLSDGQTLFCAASLVEPGTFDIAQMPHEEFRGLTLFAVLPGPADAVQTIDALMATAEDLAGALNGTVQDSKGISLSVGRAAALREDVARFQAALALA